MYGFVYKTTDLTNGKIYIGKKRCGLKDTEKYLGSGALLKKEIEKKGVLSFKREILQECKTEEELEYMEFYWIAKERALDESIGYNRSFFRERKVCEKLYEIFKDEDLSFLKNAIQQISINRLGEKTTTSEINGAKKKGVWLEK